mmetsp:Transcript_24742/g.29954  ORF Transcript_24742/g.29954 Transcript_24742/m.29954 type:complete len:815 (+) Transcript_24742:16-2460(+)|eukprot:CAMPEP_0197845920 /NCGR_PEP_ID=MMETSP1438-20131217/2773_1 /TAXON_ID=1461541 /ORGANISM="Pterosperma sp., Strain CCMP1384" /LENGTH=814 /DNA_ID=CAMNT_0043457393 /DNA_START=15 /DNA_END=2459 /DNA_ORIENTATION=-
MSDVVSTTSLQLIDADGEFNSPGVDSFAASPSLATCGSKYKVIAIMGPQSSGKSTLLNHVFGTQFQEMNAIAGRGRTTQGIWMALAPKIDEPVIVLDLEGNDGRERGEDDTAFEKQAALFAMSVADVLLVNIWCHDIGREAGAGKPLLKIVMEVQMKLFSPRKTTVLFVIRDRSKTPLDHLSGILTTDMEKLWDSIAKPAEKSNMKLTDYFELKFASLPNYEEREELFRAETCMLRERFASEDEDAFIAEGSTTSVPIDGLSYSMNSMWQAVRDNKDLDLPAHKVMVATVRCEQIATEAITELEESEEWESLQEQSKAGHVPELGSTLSQLISTAFAKYDEETGFFDVKVRDGKREEMTAKLVGVISRVLEQQLDWIHKTGLKLYEGEFTSATSESGAHFAACAQSCKQAALQLYTDQTTDTVPSQLTSDLASTVTKARSSFSSEIDKYISEVTKERVTSSMAQFKKSLSSSLGPVVASIIDDAAPNMWRSLTSSVAEITSRQQDSMYTSLKSFELERGEIERLKGNLEENAREIVDSKIEEAVKSIVGRMRDRFNKVFNVTDKGLPRTWDTRVDIGAVSKKAKLASAELLTLLTVDQRDARHEKHVSKVKLSICKLADPEGHAEGASIVGMDLFPNVEETLTLIRPTKCADLWKQFENEANVSITQAVAAQDAANRAAANGPPLWALAAIAILGYDEFMSVLYNPLLLIILLACVAVGKSLYEKCDVAQDMKHGFVPGLLLLAPKIIPAVTEYVGETIETLSKAAAEQHALAKEQVASETLKSNATATETSSVAAETAVSGEGLKQRKAAANN